jgi:hypothetical protein
MVKPAVYAAQLNSKTRPGGDSSPAGHFVIMIEARKRYMRMQALGGDL